MFGSHQPHFPQQLLISLFQGTGQFFDERMLVGCDLFDLQSQLFDLLSEGSHLAAPPAFPPNQWREECDDSGARCKSAYSQ